MPDTKILFTDIDGTLIRSDQTISDEVAKALDDMAAAGHILTLSSGRPADSIQNVFSYIRSRLKTPFKQVYIIANNGALVKDAINGQNLLEDRLPMHLVDDIQTLAEQYDIHIQTYSDTHIICTRNDEETRSYTKRVILPVMIRPVLSSALTMPPFKMLALSLKGSACLMPFRHAMEEQFGRYVNLIFSGNGYLEIVDKNADKGNALLFLCRHLGIDVSATFAAGDSENDITMLQKAGTGYAMANAVSVAKDRADRVTRNTCSEDGILEVIHALMSS